jgi:RNA polymerase sigma-70 factor (ECF subfamily)
LTQTNAQSDSHLIELSRKGDHNAFGELVVRHRSSCVNLATFILRDRAEGEDHVQQAFRKAFEHFDQYLGEAEFSVWLLRIVVNECRMSMRNKKRMPFLYLDSGYNVPKNRPMELASPTINPEDEMLKRELLEVLRTEIQHVPPLFRQVIQWRDIEGLPMQEVADRLSITVSAAKSRLLRARSELRGRVVQRCGAAKRRLPLFHEQMLPSRPVHHERCAV